MAGSGSGSSVTRVSWWVVRITVPTRQIHRAISPEVNPGWKTEAIKRTVRRQPQYKACAVQRSHPLRSETTFWDAMFPPSRLPGGCGRHLVENRTIGPVVTVAIVGQTDQLSTHGCELGNTFVERIDMT